MALTYALIQMVEKVAEVSDRARLVNKAEVFQLLLRDGKVVGLSAYVLVVPSNEGFIFDAVSFIFMFLLQRFQTFIHELFGGKVIGKLRMRVQEIWTLQQGVWPGGVVHRPLC